MIRRWSSINATNVDLLSFKKFNKLFHLYVFRASVYFKRFSIKRTKFKRKSLARWKHRSNWALYLNILKYWVSDYRFSRQTARYQFLNKIFSQSLIIYDFNQIKVRHAKVFSTISSIATVSISKKLYSYYTNRFFLQGGFINKNANRYFGFLSNDEKLEENINIVPLNAYYDDQYFSVSTDNTFDVNDINNLVFNVQLTAIVEIYKVLILAYYIKI